MAAVATARTKKIIKKATVNLTGGTPLAGSALAGSPGAEIEKPNKPLHPSPTAAVHHAHSPSGSAGSSPGSEPKPHREPMPLPGSIEKEAISSIAKALGTVFDHHSAQVRCAVRAVSDNYQSNAQSLVKFEKLFCQETTKLKDVICTSFEALQVLFDKLSADIYSIKKELDINEQKKVPNPAQGIAKNVEMTVEKYNLQVNASLKGVIESFSSSQQSINRLDAVYTTEMKTLHELFKGSFGALSSYIERTTEDVESIKKKMGMNPTVPNDQSQKEQKQKKLPPISPRGKHKDLPERNINLTDEDKNNGELLCNAAWDGDQAELRRLVALPSISHFVNFHNNRGQSSLYCATKQGHQNLLIDLLNAPGVDVNMNSALGTPLHIASSSGKGVSVAILLCAGAKSDILNRMNVTARQEACGDAEKVFAIFEAKGITGLSESYPLVLGLTCLHPERKQTTFQPGLQRSASSKQRQQQLNHPPTSDDSTTASDRSASKDEPEAHQQIDIDILSQPTLDKPILIDAARLNFDPGSRRLRRPKISLDPRSAPSIVWKNDTGEVETDQNDLDDWINQMLLKSADANDVLLSVSDGALNEQLQSIMKEYGEPVGPSPIIGPNSLGTPGTGTSPPSGPPIAALIAGSDSKRNIAPRGLTHSGAAPRIQPGVLPNPHNPPASAYLDTIDGHFALPIPAFGMKTAMQQPSHVDPPQPAKDPGLRPLSPRRMTIGVKTNLSPDPSQEHPHLQYPYHKQHQDQCLAQYKKMNQNGWRLEKDSHLQLALKE